jgi:hypothetical protein
VTNVFAAIGQHRDDPDRFLLLGSDGLHYAQALPDGEPEQVELDESWQVDGEVPDPEEIAG